MNSYHNELTELTESSSEAGVLTGEYFYNPNTNKLTKDLCPGTYYVVVDGWFSGYEGAFKLEVTSTALTVATGAIVLSTGGTYKYL